MGKMKRPYTRKPTATKEDASRLFKMLDPEDGRISEKSIWKKLNSQGIYKSDQRLASVCEILDLSNEDCDGSLNKEQFVELLDRSVLIKRALNHELVIPDFKTFTDKLTEIFQDVEGNLNGRLANYIPQLKKVDPTQFGLSLMTIDGQQFCHGEHATEFSLQSCCKPINYLIATEDLGEQEVHKFIGKEPSGRSFNEMALNHEGLPHNPLINSGAIMCCSLIKRALTMDERFDHIKETWKNLAGGREPNFNNSVYQSEKRTADRNFALSYFMRENKAFPEDTNLRETLEFYFQCCSIDVDADMLASAASTLANGGVHAQTESQIFNTENVKNCLTLMNTCGMYDFSGEFAFQVGLPAKSSVSGAVMVVVPNVMGFCIWSPKLDIYGNSVRGIEFCNKLVENYNFHNYDTMLNVSDKTDPRKKKFETTIEQSIALIMASAKGDLAEIQRLQALGVPLDVTDYDGRSALHLAAAEGQEEITRYLISEGAPIDQKDRWGHTPKNDAEAQKHKEIVDLLNT